MDVIIGIVTLCVIGFVVMIILTVFLMIFAGLPVIGGLARFLLNLMGFRK